MHSIALYITKTSDYYLSILNNRIINYYRFYKSIKIGKIVIKNPYTTIPCKYGVVINFRPLQYKYPSKVTNIEIYLIRYKASHVTYENPWFIGEY